MMSAKELDHILAAKRDIQPSEQFLSSVMAAVRSEAATPPPIPFPWKRALPGLLIGLAAFIWFVANQAQQAETVFVAVELAPVANFALWIAGAVLMTLCLLIFSMRIASR